MWYKKKRVIAAILVAVLAGLGGVLGFDLSNLEVPFTETACQALECIE